MATHNTEDNSSGVRRLRTLPHKQQGRTSCQVHSNYPRASNTSKLSGRSQEPQLNLTASWHTTQAASMQGKDQVHTSDLSQAAQQSASSPNKQTQQLPLLAAQARDSTCAARMAAVMLSVEQSCEVAPQWGEQAVAPTLLWSRCSSAHPLQKLQAGVCQPEMTLLES
eukprot:4546610-Amphidinium_carterae.1